MVEAWWDLARIYDWPRFAGRDPRRAREYLERAARENVGAAQLALGERLAAISDTAPPPAGADEPAQAATLAAIADEHPALAARLRLAANFGLTQREALFLDVVRADQGWCLLADVSEHFQYKPWRLVRVDRPRRPQGRRPS